MVPGIPFEDELTGTVFDMTMLAQRSLNVIVLAEALDDGLRNTNILSVAATFAAIASSEIFLLFSAMIHQLSVNSYCSNS